MIPGNYLRQKKLLDRSRLSGASVAIVGLGGLGCPAAAYLAMAGIGKLFLIDRDVVEESNLNRQFLYSEGDVGREKATVAAEKLWELSPGVEIVPIVGDGVRALGKISLDCVLDCTDNLESRLGLSKLCQVKKIPVVFGSAVGWTGSVAVFAPGSFCLSCFIGAGKKPDSCGEMGIVGPVAGAIGALQAVEALKIISKRPDGKAARRGVRYFDFLSGKNWLVRVKKRADCPVCGKKR
ncbi:MAG: HesA/MoeB/ThiF family protein [archaeon]